jgi:hypothetical protein
MNLRVIGLTAVVVFTALVPLAASAGPAGGSRPEPVSGPVLPPADAKGGEEPGVSAVARSAAERSGAAEGAGPRTAERCGPEVASPQGVEAQTCVLTAERGTWARTYYRNTTGAELRSVLSLMGPGGRTVQTNCAVAADEEPAVCETPREKAGGSARYSAVAEFAAPAPGGGAGRNGRAIEPLLLRSGSDVAANS